jgi:hypothetical protein
MKQTNKESSFSIELKSKENLETINLANGTSKSVLIEGTIGQLLNAQFDEGIVLAVTGKKGTLRLDLTLEQIQNKNTIEVKKQ